MDFTEQGRKLQAIYACFDSEVLPYRRDAACRIGCSFCCTAMGNVDITTLEGRIILEYIRSMPDPDGAALKNRIVANKLAKEKGKKPPCPFQDNQGACRIYEYRPFSCRQLYSLRKCGQDGPLIHRAAVTAARNTVRRIQALDRNGYSGHISYILYLLYNDNFMKVYDAGGFQPDKINKFGKTHKIIINRLVENGSDARQ